MNAKEIKAEVRHGAEHIDNEIAAAAASIHNGSIALGQQRDELEHRLRGLGRRLIDSGKALAADATKPAQLQTLAWVGLALVAGTLIVRGLRR